ncbi:MAG: NUDIX domain-containing protein [Candidatus Woesearchaeota archaeon]|nr:NUDIX domain-containing protein [Candidatus Woesearchaeota archaeon]
MQIEKSCGAVIFREFEGRNLFLILKHKAGHWDFSKGHVEGSESGIETAKREAVEETGIGELNFFEGFLERIGYFFKEGGIIHKKEVFFYLAKTSEEKVNLSFEHTAFEWLSYEDALNKVTFKNSKKVLKSAQEFLEKYKESKK